MWGFRILHACIVNNLLPIGRRPTVDNTKIVKYWKLYKFQEIPKFPPALPNLQTAIYFSPSVYLAKICLSHGYIERLQTLLLTIIGVHVFPKLSDYIIITGSVLRRFLISPVSTLTPYNVRNMISLRRNLHRNPELDWTTIIVNTRIYNIFGHFPPSGFYIYTLEWVRAVRFHQ